jgi:hypothetical protein
MAAAAADTCKDEGTHHKKTASLAGTYAAYPCEETVGTEEAAAGTSDSKEGAPATSESLGTLSRKTLIVGFIGHLYLAVSLSHFKAI